MINLGEKNLDDYLNLRDKRPNSRLLADRIFRGVVRTVTISATGFITVRVSRTGDTAQDNTDYACTIAGYVPTIGDTVDLFWRSRKEAVVFQVVTRAPMVQFGSISLVIAITTREITGAVVFPVAYPAAIVPVVLTTIQNISVSAAAERPMDAAAFSVTNLGFSISLDAFANVAAARTIIVGWKAIG